MIEVRDTVTDWLKAKTSVSFRGRVARARVDARGWNAGLRVLPDFLLIGAQRCGTSSLYTYLGRHPRVVPSLRKEVEYLSTRFGEGEGWYRAHFPMRARLAVSQMVRRSRIQTFEATPDYMLDPRAPGRAAALLPEARILVLVRDPVERAYSQFMHNRRLGHEELTFAEALELEPTRTSGELSQMASDPWYHAKPLRRFGYVARGRYAEQLEGWLAYYPRDRIHVIQTESFFDDTPASFAEILRFLGLPDWRPAQFGNHSAGSPGRSKKGMAGEVRERLTETFREPNRRLFDLLGRDLGWES